MTDLLYPIRPEIAAATTLTKAQHEAWSAQALENPAAFWGEQAKRIDWIKAPTETVTGDFTGDVRVRWYGDGVLNASANCLDRHLADRPDQVAIIWEGDDPATTRSVTYRELHGLVCRAANALGTLGVKKGDRVTIYLPMVVEAAVAMLACARLGAVHAIVFGGFSPDSLANRIQDCDSTVLITADEGRRGGRRVALKTNADAALKTCPTIRHVLVVTVTGGDVPMQDGRDHRWETLLHAAAPHMPARADGRGGPALHPLHVRQHRKAERRAAHHRRLHGLGQLHPPVRLRLPARRGILVHRRRRLGHGAHIHRLWSAGERCDHR